MPKASKIIDVRAFIPEEIITNFNEVYLQANVKIKGDEHPEKMTSVYAYSIDSTGKPIPLTKDRLISNFE